MFQATTLLFLVVIAELTRQFCLSIHKAFFGPLAKIPGPFINKLTQWPWVYQIIRGNGMNVGPKLFEKYGDVVRIAPNEVIFRSKDAVQKIVVEFDLKKSYIYSLIQQNSDVHSLITEQDSKKYKKMRRPLSEAFSISYLNGLEDSMHSCIDLMAEILTSRCDNAQTGPAIVDIATMLENLTMDVMSDTLFGGSFGLVANNDRHMKNLFIKHLERRILEAAFPFVRYIPFMSNPIDEMDRIIDGILATRREENSKGQTRRDILQIFLENNKANPVHFSDKHLYDEMRLFVIAGSDTTAFTATATLLLLLNNPAKMKCLVEEIMAAFPKKTDAITYGATNYLYYLNAAINESMRLMPIIVIGLPRSTSETTFIDGYEIPAECITTAHVSELQKDPRIWPDAESYIPERWLGDYKGVPVDRKAFMPFSAGMRNCIGQQFALRELRLILVTLIRQFELSLVDGQSHEMRNHMIPYLKDGQYLVGLKKRED